MLKFLTKYCSVSSLCSYPCCVIESLGYSCWRRAGDPSGSQSTKFSKWKWSLVCVAIKRHVYNVHLTLWINKKLGTISDSKANRMFQSCIEQYVTKWGKNPECQTKKNKYLKNRVKERKIVFLSVQIICQRNRKNRIKAGVLPGKQEYMHRYGNAHRLQSSKCNISSQFCVTHEISYKWL